MQKRKQEGKAERNRCYSAGQRWHLVALVLVPATPTPWGEIQFPPDYTVFLAVKTRTMDPTPPAAAPNTNQNVSMDRIVVPEVLTPSKTFFFKEGRAQQLILDSRIRLIFLTSISRAPIMARHTMALGTQKQQQPKILLSACSALTFY